MVETISPVVYGRRNLYRRAVAAHVAGAALGAACLGAAAGAAGALAGAPWGPWGWAGVAAVAACGGLAHFLRVPLRPPSRREQVPEWWRTFFGPATAAGLYGVSLGAGFFTPLTGGALFVATGAAASSGHPGLGALVVLPFGIARGVAVAAATRAATATPPSTLARLEARSAAGLPQRLDLVALTAVVLAGAAAALA